MRVSRAIRMESRTARASSAVSKDSWAPCLKRVRCRRAEPPGPLPKQSGNADPLLVRRLWTSEQSRKGPTLTHGRGLTAAARCVHSGDSDRSHRSATAASTGSSTGGRDPSLIARNRECAEGCDADGHVVAVWEICSQLVRPRDFVAPNLSR